MNERRGGLGRGLAALIPSSSTSSGSPGGPSADSAAADFVIGRSSDAPERPKGSAQGETSIRGEKEVQQKEQPSGIVDSAVYREVPIETIKPNPKQPRQVFDQESLAELEHSIREFGLLQPIIVRELGTETFELVMGERRLRASQRAGLTSIPAIVRQTADDAMLRDALLENIHRVQLNPLEEAAAYQQLLQEFNVTHEQLADRIGRSRPVITNTIRLLRLPIVVQRRVAAGVLSAGHARALLGLDDAGEQEELARRIIAEGMSVRAAEEAVTLAKRNGPAKQRKVARKPMQAPGLQDLAERLSDTFETRVKVEFGQRKGRIVVEFGSVEDLERIVSVMTPTRAT